MTGFGWAHRLHEVLDDGDRTGVAEPFEPLAHGDAVVKVILSERATNLIFEGIEFGDPLWSGCRFRTGSEVLAYGVAGQTGLADDLADGMALGGQVTQGVHSFAPEHGPLRSGGCRPE